MTWFDDQKWESDWWGNCVNTLREELLQFSYAQRMGLKTFYDGRSDYNIDMQGKSVLDIGGGPVSLLLKCKNVKGAVMDPCDFPEWVSKRYEAAGIVYIQVRGEHINIVRPNVDEIWVYNVLQHVTDPEDIIRKSRERCKTIRIFEWVEAGVSPGHPHNLTEEKLNEWLGGKGTTEQFLGGEYNEPLAARGAQGKCYYGVFECGL